MVTRASGRAALISASISLAAIAIAGLYPRQPRSARPFHPGRKVTFVSSPQRRDRYGYPFGQCQILSAAVPELRRGGARRLRGTDQRGGVRDSQHVAALVLAEPEGVARKLAR